MSQGLIVPICPQCDFENAEHYRFCPKCRFPLMLLAGKYQLERALAQGGMGQVYLARHVRLDHDTERVIKVIKPEVFAAPGMDVRFRREVQVTAALSQRNDHIVRIYDDFGEEESFGHYYVMEYLHGQTLKEHLATSKGIPNDLAFHIFYQFCRAMAGAHREKIVHRDLKPDNVFLIRREDDAHFVKVIDFGIARPEDSEAGTQLTQGILGTPQYMSPEQCENKPIDGRSDIYSMGLILYEMLTGANAYGLSREELSGSSPLGMISAHLLRDLIPLSSVRDDLPQALSDVLLQAMARKPDDRFDSVESFWNAIATAEPLDHPLPVLSGTSTPRQLLRSTAGALSSPQENQAVSGSRSPSSSTAAIGSPNSRVLVNDGPVASQPAPRAAGSPRWLWAFSSVGLLAFGVLVWWIVTAPKANKAVSGGSVSGVAQRLTPGPLRKVLARAGKVPHPSPQAIPDAPAAPKRPVVERPATRRKVVPTQATKVIARKIQKSPRRRMIRRRSVQRVTRRRAHSASSGPCGQASGGHRWVFAAMGKPRRGRPSLRFFSCSKCRMIRRKGGYCLLLPTDKQVRMRISVNGYTSCSFRLPPRARKIRWQLQQEDPDALSDESYACVVSQ